MVERALVERAKADPEAFRRETVEAFEASARTMRAWGVAGKLERMTVEESLRKPWALDDSRDPVIRSREERAKAHNDALLQALQEMTPAERERLGW